MRHNLIVDLTSGVRHHITYDGALEDCRAAVANQFGVLHLQRVWVRSGGEQDVTAYFRDYHRFRQRPLIATTDRLFPESNQEGKNFP